MGKDEFGDKRLPQDEKEEFTLDLEKLKRQLKADINLKATEKYFVFERTDLPIRGMSYDQDANRAYIYFAADSDMVTPESPVRVYQRLLKETLRSSFSFQSQIVDREGPFKTEMRRIVIPLNLIKEDAEYTRVALEPNQALRAIVSTLASATKCPEKLRLNEEEAQDCIACLTGQRGRKLNAGLAPGVNLFRRKDLPISQIAYTPDEHNTAYIHIPESDPVSENARAADQYAKTLDNKLQIETSITFDKKTKHWVIGVPFETLKVEMPRSVGASSENMKQFGFKVKAMLTALQSGDLPKSLRLGASEAKTALDRLANKNNQLSK